MLTAMPAQNIFTFCDFSSPYRPPVSSPLSSSPIRASQVSSPPQPLSPRNPNRRDVQSSPIRAPKFKYASRPSKPNPLRQGRENAQESRRKLFLNNVRQRQEDKAWERRGGDQQLQQIEWRKMEKRWREQQNADIDGVMFDEDIEDIPSVIKDRGPEEMMVDDIARQEAEVDAMLSMFELQSSPQAPTRPKTPTLSDDDDYDSIFMDLIISQQEGNDGSLVLSGEMDLS